MKHIMLAFLMLLVVSTASASGKAISYKVNGKAFEGYFVSPSANAPLVLLIHDWDGLTDYEIKRADMLAELGYAVFAADLYGAGIRPTEIEDKQLHTAKLYKDRGLMRAYIDAALDAAKTNGADIHNAVAMGYCFGGAAVLELARSGVDLKGFVTFHGGLSTPAEQDYAATKGQLLVLHGTADTSVSMDDFAKLAMELEASGIKHEMISYSGAPHAFTVFDSERYREDADKKSWQRFTTFLKETLN